MQISGTSLHSTRVLRIIPGPVSQTVQGLVTPRACHNFRVKLASLILTVTAGLNGQRLGMRAKNFVFNRGVSCFIRGVSCFIRGVSCFIRGVSCFIRCILSCFIRYNPVFQSWSSRRERVK